VSPACRGPMVAKPPVEHRANVIRTMPRARGNDNTRRTETPRTDERRSHTPRIEAPRDKTPRSSVLNCGASMRLQTQVSATTPVQGDHPSADEA